MFKKLGKKLKKVGKKVTKAVRKAAPVLGLIPGAGAIATVASVAPSGRKRSKNKGQAIAPEPFPLSPQLPAASSEIEMRPLNQPAVQTAIATTRRKLSPPMIALIVAGGALAVFFVARKGR